MKVLIPKSQKEFFQLSKQGMSNIGMKVPDGMDVVHMMVDGKVQKWAVDKDLATAMKTLDQHQAPKVMHMINNIFRQAATTAYMPFTITNAFRDAMLAYTTAPVYQGNALKSIPQFTKDWIQGLYHGVKHEKGQWFKGAQTFDDKMVREYLEKGGGFGWSGEIRKPKALKGMLFKEKKRFDQMVADGAVTVLKSPLDLAKHASGAIELAPRLAVYNRAIKNGATPEAATMMARQATIDFNRGGTWMKALNQWIPFLNARVQGRYTAAKSLMDPKNRPRTMAKIATTVMLPAATAYYMHRTYFGDLYDDIPEYIKNNYFVMVTGSKEDPDTGKQVPTYVTIPKGDIGMLWNPIEQSLEKLFHEKDISWQEMAVDFLSDLSPVQFAREGEIEPGVALSSVMPPVAKGVLEGVANTNLYTGLDVVPEFQREQKPDYLIYRDSTPEEYKWFARELKNTVGFDISPLSMQQFASNLFAGYGRQGLSPKAMLDGLTGRLFKSKGGAKQQEALEYVHEIKTGYIETRALAEQLVQQGRRGEAMRLIRLWNQGLNKRVTDFNKRFKKYDIRDRGGLRFKYNLSAKKVFNMYKKQRKRKLTPLEKKLQRGQY
jgi:hypothetical protein